MENPNHLFAYGTLQIPEIMGEVCGRIPESVPATLKGFEIFRLADQPYPSVYPNPSQAIEGVLYKSLTQAELARLDDYEGQLYNRVMAPITLKPSCNAWVYRLNVDHMDQHSDFDWNLADYKKRFLHIHWPNLKIS